MRHITTYKLYESSENYDYNGIIYITESNAIDNLPCIQYWFYINDQSERYKHCLAISSVSRISLINDWISDFLSIYTWFDSSDTEWVSFIELYNRPNNILSYGLIIDNINNLKFGDDGDHDVLKAFDEFKRKLDFSLELVKVEMVSIDKENSNLTVDVIDRWER